MKVFKIVCNVLSTLILLALAVIAAALLIPRVMGYSQYAVLSGSMEPNIHVGAIVYDKAFDESELEVGKVVTYQLSDGTLVTHRVVDIDQENQCVTTQGDANDAPDASEVYYSNIVGIYGFNIPYLGYISIYGRTQLGIGAICGVIMVLILLNFLPDALSGEEDEKDKSKNILKEQEI